MGGRTDFDVRVYWTLMNFGAGNSALIKRRRADVGEAVAARSIMINQIRAEVTSARGNALAQQAVIPVAQARVKSAEDGYAQDRARLRETLALPIEALDSLKLLADARLSLIEAITRTNIAQFALLVSLGTPPPPGSGPAAQPANGPPPVNTPLHGPIVSPGIP
jgi:outer membrane protein TolC